MRGEESNLQVHITNIYGQSFTSTALKAQNRVTDVARKLNYKELGIYHYNVASDSPEMLTSRLDGIIASVGHGDIVIFQFPTWNGIQFDEALVKRLRNYKELKKIFFIHDIPPLMFEENSSLLNRYISLFNQADLIILSSQRMIDFLYTKGMIVKKTVVQKMWDFPITIDKTIVPKFRRVINFAGKPDLPKFEFVKTWDYDEVELKVTAEKEEWGQGKNIGYLGWFKNDISLLTALRESGGFGLVWTEDSYFGEYIKMNTNYKFSAYLAAGIPVIVSNNIAERDTVVRKNLGFTVDSLDEAVSKIVNMSESQYNKMVSDVNRFSDLIREGYFTQKCLTDAVFKLLYE
jgi:hypothetical protein